MYTLGGPFLHLEIHQVQIHHCTVKFTRQLQSGIITKHEKNSEHSERNERFSKGFRIRTIRTVHKTPGYMCIDYPNKRDRFRKNTVLKYVRTLIRGTAFILSANYLCLICSEKRVVLH